MQALSSSFSHVNNKTDFAYELTETHVVQSTVNLLWGALSKKVHWNTTKNFGALLVHQKSALWVHCYPYSVPLLDDRVGQMVQTG